MKIAAWQEAALVALGAAYPEAEWGVDTLHQADLMAYFGDTPVRVARGAADGGWFRVTIYDTPQTMGMDPTDPVRAVRSALRRRAARAPAARGVVTSSVGGSRA